MACAATAQPQSVIHGTVETVEDDRRQPVAEAVVRAFVDEEAVAVAFSDREGRYALEVPAETFELRLVKPGYVVANAAGIERPSIRRTCRGGGDCGAVDFLLEKAAAVEAWVTDPSGDPFPGAHLRLTAAGHEEDAAEEGETDERGVKRFHGLAPGRYRLDVLFPTIHAGIGRLFESDGAQLDLRPGENSPVYLSARSAGADTVSFSGLIEGMGETKRPYELLVRPLGGGPRSGLTVRQVGPEINLPRLAKGEYVVQLLEGDQAVMLGRFRLEGNQRGVVLRPTKLPLLLGHVTFEEGVPDSVSLTLHSDDGWDWARVQVYRRDRNFEVRDAPPGRYTLTSDSEDFFVVDEPDIHLPDGGSQAVQLTVSASFGRVVGTIHGAEGRAVRVELHGPRGESSVVTGPDGGFGFDRLVPGDYTLCPAAPGGACSSERRRGFAIEAGDEIEIELGAPE